MHWLSLLVLLFITGPAWALEDFLLGAGVESDSGDGLSGIVIANLGLTKKTRLNGSFGKSDVPLPSGRHMNTSYGDIGIDHWFDPVGIQLMAAYWGNNDIFDSVDSRASIYWRNDRTRLSADFERRAFEFDIFRGDLLPGQDFRFDATGIGLSVRTKLGDSVSMRLSAKDYDYNVDLRLDANSRITDLLSVTRLSLINSLIDYRVGAGIDIDVGKRVWSLDYGIWKGEVDGGVTHSATLRFLTPAGSKSDIEFGLGIDDSDLYGSVTFLSIFLYFYGGI